MTDLQPARPEQQMQARASTVLPPARRSVPYAGMIFWAFLLLSAIEAVR